MPVLSQKSVSLRQRGGREVRGVTSCRHRIGRIGTRTEGAVDHSCDLSVLISAQWMTIRSRASQATYSSGGSSALDDQERCGSNPEASNHSVISDPLSSEDAISGHSGKRHSLFSIRWSKLPSPASPVAPPRSPTVPTYPRSLHTGDSTSRSRVCSYSSASVVLEDREYVSFLEF